MQPNHTKINKELKQIAGFIGRGYAKEIAEKCNNINASQVYRIVHGEITDYEKIIEFLEASKEIIDQKGIRSDRIRRILQDILSPKNVKI